jgi:hypothetical protein
MKLLHVLVVCLTVWLVASKQGDSQKHVTQPQNPNAQHQVASPPTLAQSATQHTDSGDRGDDQHQPQKVSVVSIPEVRTEQRWIDWLTVFFSFVLAVTAIFGTCYAIKTLKAIRHEADIAIAALKQTGRFASATIKNAQAAEHSANSVKNIYRAWVLTRWNHRGSDASSIDLWARNYGQTPAQVTARHCKMEVIKESDLTKLPSSPNYGPNRIAAPEMIPPREEVSILHTDIKTSAEITGEWDEVWSGRKITVIYGLIQYRDVLDPSVEHETRFCYWHSFKREGLNVGGPPEYNGAT